MADKTEDTGDIILNLLNANNSNASLLLYRCHYKAVYAYTKDSVRSHDDTKDIIQELFIAIWVKRHSLHLTTPLRSYLFCAAHNKAISFLRDKGRQNRMMGEVVNRSGIKKITFERLD